MRRPAEFRISSWLKGRFLGLFLGAILVPGIVLGIFAFRSLHQDRLLAERRLQERIEGAAERAAARMKEEWVRWGYVLEEISRDSDPGSHSERYADSGVIVITDGGRIVMPKGALLYAIDDAVEPLKNDFPPAAYQAVESRELRGKNLTHALHGYRNLLKNTRDPNRRAWLLHRIGRTLRKSGKLEEALNCFQQLADLSSTSVASLPAELIARYEICAIMAQQNNRDPLLEEASLLYEKLVSPSWGALGKERYFYYSQTVRAWLGESAPAAVVAREEELLLLTRAAEQTLSEEVRLFEDPHGPYIALTSTAAGPRTALLLTRRYLQKELWPKLEVVRDSDLALWLIDARGKVILGQGDAPTSWTATQDLNELRLPWKIVAAPLDSEALVQQFRLRQNLYLGLLVMVAGLLAFGAYMTVRIVRRELEVSRLKADFVATVSHEFRSPLTGIRQLAEMLSRGRVKKEEKKAEYYELICEESDRLTRLVENVLDFSRIEEGRKQFHFEPIDTVSWLRGVADSFQKRRRIETKIPDQLPAIQGDREALTSVVANLLENAIKYSPVETPIHLAAVATDGWLSISVIDQGSGIAPGEQDRIFEKFYRGGNGSAREVKGVGLGLALVKHIVNGHGGEFSVASEPGEGSTFTVRLREGK